MGNKRRSDAKLGMRLFHRTFGYGIVERIEGNKLEIGFEQAGRKWIMDMFADAE